MISSIRPDNPPPINEASRPGRLSSGPSLEISFVNVVRDGPTTVYERMFLIHGTVSQNYTGTVVVQSYGYPDQQWPVTQGYFKALLPLEPGPNRVAFLVFYGDRQQALNYVDFTYIPLVQDPPVHFCLILGKDSKGTFDSPRYKKDREGNSLDLAVKKMRLASYMMSAFTQEQMYRNGLGYRTFRPHEERQADSITNRDEEEERFTTKVHVVRCDKTVAEILDPDKAQQSHDGKDKGALFGIALDALRNYQPFVGKNINAACIFVDSHWDPDLKLIRGHAALGGGAGGIKLAIFGGHALHSWPSCLEEVVPSFMDDTRTDTSQVANDSNQSGTSWEALNIGMGAFMHEIGHLLGCPHQPSGVMLRDYITWNRTFMTREAFCARTKKPGLSLCLPKDECGWHRLDVLRFKYHRSFRIPYDPLIRDTSRPNLYPFFEGVFAKSDTGIYLVEIHVDNFSRGHFEYPTSPIKEILLSEDRLLSQLPEKYRDRDKNIKLRILAVGGEQIEIDNYRKFISESHFIEDGNSRSMLFKCNKLGGDGGKEQVVVFPPDKKIIKVIVFSGRALDGIDFIFNDNSVLTFGKHGGNPHEVNFSKLEGFSARTGAWVDGLQVLSSNGKSPVFGNAKGGSRHEFVPPQGYDLAGVYGNVGAWVISFGIIYTNNYY